MRVQVLHPSGNGLHRVGGRITHWAGIDGTTACVGVLGVSEGTEIGIYIMKIDCEICLEKMVTIFVTIGENKYYYHKWKCPVCGFCKELEFINGKRQTEKKTD